MFVEDMLEAARERLVTIADDAKLIEAAKLLTSGTDLVVVRDGVGVLQGVVTRPTWSDRSASVRAQPASGRCARQ